MTRISKVGKEVVDRSSARVVGLEPSTHHRQHGQPPILDLLCPQLLDFLRRTASPAKWVEPQPTWVPYVGPSKLVVGEDGVGVHAPRLEDVRPPSPLGPPDEDQLNDEESCFISEVLELASSVP